MTSIITWACRSIERFGLALVPLPHATKAPIHEGWQRDENLIRTVEQASAHWSQDNHRHDGMGMCLEPSRKVSIDADHPAAYDVLLKEGFDLRAFSKSAATIKGRAERIECEAPPRIALGRKSVTWPPPAPGEKPITVIEFRAGRVQDVLPPSIHPDTRRPYEWLTPPRNGFTPLPDELLRLWIEFDQFAHRARNLCPWAPPEPASLERPRVARPLTGPSVIAAFNDAHDAVSILATHGYMKAGKRRWKSPNGHGLAGVVVLDSGKVYCHHKSDPLGDERAHDPFDLYCLFEHGGDTSRAVRAAAELLGLRREARA